MSVILTATRILDLIENKNTSHMYSHREKGRSSKAKAITTRRKRRVIYDTKADQGSIYRFFADRRESAEEEK